jgi:RHS repeat-associated protein
MVKIGNNTNDWEMYVDGQTVPMAGDNNVQLTGVNVTNNEPLILGGRSYGGGYIERLQGSMKGANFYLRALPTAEIVERFAQGCNLAPANTDALLLSMPLTDGEGNTTANNAAGGQIGNIVQLSAGNAWTTDPTPNLCNTSPSFVVLQECMGGTSYVLGGYRYGFNGKENDNEVEGEGNQQDYGMRIYDPRLGRFLSVDPLSPQYPWYTPYQFAGNKPIWATDRDGLEESGPTMRMTRMEEQFANGEISEKQFKEFHQSLAVPAVVGVAVLAAVAAPYAIKYTYQVAMGSILWATRPENQQYVNEGLRFLTGLMTPPEAGIPDDPTSVADDGGRFVRNVVKVIWIKAYGTTRGKILEGILSGTRYKLWNYIAGSNTKLIDFTKELVAVSLKTFDAQKFSLGGKKGFKTIVDNLFEAVNKGGTEWLGVKYTFNKARLDIMFKDDATIKKFKNQIAELFKYANETTEGKVKINIFVDPNRVTK